MLGNAAAQRPSCFHVQPSIRVTGGGPSVLDRRLASQTSALAGQLACYPTTQHPPRNPSTTRQQQLLACSTVRYGLAAASSASWRARSAPALYACTATGTRRLCALSPPHRQSCTRGGAGAPPAWPLEAAAAAPPAPSH